MKETETVLSRDKKPGIQFKTKTNFDERTPKDLGQNVLKKLGKETLRKERIKHILNTLGRGLKVS